MIFIVVKESLIDGIDIKKKKPLKSSIGRNWFCSLWHDVDCTIIDRGI